MLGLCFAVVRARILAMLALVGGLGWCGGWAVVWFRLLLWLIAVVDCGVVVGGGSVCVVLGVS